MTRTQNSFFNMVTGLGSSLLMITLNFITRRVFIQTIGSDYLGVEGLFTNILSMLNLANLGFGSAIVFKLYKPLEERDQHRIQILIKLYRQVYFCVGTFIAVAGLCLIPFLPRLIRDYSRYTAMGLQLVPIFLLYLFDTVTSYWFFAYKSSLVNAAQKGYILTLIGYAASVGQSLAQIAALALTHSFFLYICAQIAFTVLRNILNARVCDRRFPYIRQRTEDRVSREELKELFRGCGAVLAHQVSGTAINSTDNIVLSTMAGLATVGLYSNYLTIKRQLQGLLESVITATQASLGSLYTTGNLEWSRLTFRVIHFFTSWLYTIAAVGLALLLDDFIGQLWLGPDFVVTSWTMASGQVVPTPLALLVGIETFLSGQTVCIWIFRNSTGMFRYIWRRPIFSVLVNLGVSILLVPYLGIAGCVVGTIATYALTYLTVDPYVIWTRAFEASPVGYYLKTVEYTAVAAAAGALTWWVYSLTPLTGILGFLVHGCLCAIVPSVVYLLLFHRTSEFRYLLGTLRELLAGQAEKKNDEGDQAP